jgi:hypothetical protein
LRLRHLADDFLFSTQNAFPSSSIMALGLTILISRHLVSTALGVANEKVTFLQLLWAHPFPYSDQAALSALIHNKLLPQTTRSASCGRGPGSPLRRRASPTPSSTARVKAWPWLHAQREVSTILMTLYRHQRLLHERRQCVDLKDDEAGHRNLAVFAKAIPVR